jgi:type VI protein secretion system component VasK
MSEDQDFESDAVVRIGGFQVEGVKALFVIIALLLIVSSLAVALLGGVVAVFEGQISTASQYASFVSGIATMGLVILTGLYVSETRRLAEETEQARKDEQRYREAQKVEDLNKLRRALIQEIGNITNLKEFASDYTPSHNIYRSLIASAV